MFHTSASISSARESEISNAIAINAAIVGRWHSQRNEEKSKERSMEGVSSAASCWYCCL